MIHWISFIVCGEIEQYFDVMGVPGQVTRTHLQALLESRLIEPYNPTVPEAPPLRLAKVIFYNPKKEYGFLRPDDGSRDILLPRRILNTIGLAEIDEGETLLVESAMEIKGPVATAIAQN
jgi:cold shock CspA family protein